MKAALLRPFSPAAPVLPLLCGLWLFAAAGALPAQQQEPPQPQTPAPSQTTPTPPPLPEALKSALQTGLFEEEANRDFDKAITAYRAALELYDEQRAGAATVLYRLAECLRKNNQPAEAVPLYRRVLAEFPAETDLCADARRRLAELVPGEPADPGAPPPMTREEANLLADLRVLAERNPEMLEKRQSDFYNAAGNGWLQVVRFLTEHKVQSLNYSDMLIQAAGAGHLPVVEYLLDHGADAKKDGGTALVAAIDKGKVAVTYKLIERGADLNAGAGSRNDRAFFVHSDSQESPLVLRPLALALEEKDDSLVRYLVEKGARCDQPSEAEISKSKSPLHLAWNAELARFLLEHGADREARDSEGLTPLLAQAGAGNYEVAEELIAAGADLTAKDSADGTLVYRLTQSVSNHPAFTAAPEEYTPLSLNENKTLTKDDPRIPALREQAVRILDTAVKAGVPVNGLVKQLHQFQANRPPEVMAELPVFPLACEWMTTSAQAAFMEELIKRGAEVNFADSNGVTPLHTAAYRRNGPLIEVLLKHGANPLAETSAPMTTNNGEFEWKATGPGSVARPGVPRPVRPFSFSRGSEKNARSDFFRYRPMHLIGVKQGGWADRETILLLARATHARDFDGRNSGIWYDYSPLELPYNARGGLNIPTDPPLYKLADPALDGKVPVTLIEAVLRATPGLAQDASPEIHILRRRPDNDREAEDIVFDLNALTAAEPPAIPEMKPGDVLLLLPRPTEIQPPNNNEVVVPLPRDLALYLEEKQTVNITLAMPESAADLNGDWRIYRPVLNPNGVSKDIVRRTAWNGRSLQEATFGIFSGFGNSNLMLRRIIRTGGEPVLELAPEQTYSRFIFLRDGDRIEFEETTPPQAGQQASPPAAARPFYPGQPGRQRTVLPTQ